VYNQQFNLIGFGGEIFSGIKHLYDVAGTKLKNFVKGGNQPSNTKGGGGVELNVNRHGVSQMP
jgi:hypothetical protein